MLDIIPVEFDLRWGGFFYYYGGSFLVGTGGGGGERGEGRVGTRDVDEGRWVAGEAGVGFGCCCFFSFVKL